MVKKALVCSLLMSTMVSLPAWADDRHKLFRFDGGIGSQPFRSGPLPPPQSGNGPVPNTVAGVTPGGTPWPITSFRAQINTDGRIRAVARGILLGGGDGIGTRGAPRQMVLSLFCRNAPVAPAVTGTLQTTPYNSTFVDLDADGDFRLDSMLTDASGATPPANCGDTAENRPVLLIRTVTNAAAGSWFAAGILKSNNDD